MGAKETTKETSVDVTKSLPVGKKMYDLYEGKWTPLKTKTDYFTGKSVVISWKFLREQKPKRTGIPLEPHRAQRFNEDFRSENPQSLSLQYYISGSDEDITYSKFQEENGN